MTNEEKFKTPEERLDAFNRYCRNHNCKNCQVRKIPQYPEGRVGCIVRWLAFEAEEELLPCPFCGSKAEVVETHPVSTKSVFVRCQECGAFVTAFSTRDEAVAAWNRRAK